jgi:DNA-binding MarR family transcriptional regulator
MSARPQKARSAPTLESEVFAALLRASHALEQGADRLLKTHQLTAAQYNVLRILRGALPAGLPCRSIIERMISHDPDMTRLLDRMEKRGMITRERQTDDRRVIKTRITPHGLDILKSLDQPVREVHKRQFHHISAAHLKLLGKLLQDLQHCEPG